MDALVHNHTAIKPPARPRDILRGLHNKIHSDILLLDLKVRLWLWLLAYDLQRSYHLTVVRRSAKSPQQWSNSLPRLRASSSPVPYHRPIARHPETNILRRTASTATNSTTSTTAARFLWTRRLDPSF